eukprot:jgi/Phyca11/511721/fgenesh2_kg.PHYCAscaffold_95_\
MLESCGGYTYRAVVSVLRGAVENQKPDIIDSMVELLDNRSFHMPLKDAYELVHLCQKNDLALKMLDIIRVFEKSNLKDVPVAEDGKGNLEAAFFKRLQNDVYAPQKVKTMYKVALRSCEKNGLWKQAFALRDQMTTLLGQETMEEITASHSGSSKKFQEREE